MPINPSSVDIKKKNETKLYIEKPINKDYIYKPITELQFRESNKL